MANTYTAIATVTATTSVASLAFTSIPATYTDLLLKISTRSTYSANFSRARLQINSLTTGYNNRLVYGQGTTTSSASSTDYITFFYSTGSTATASTFANIEIYLPNYTSANAKSASSDSVTENNATEAFLALAAGLQTSTAAISSLTITDANAGDFVQYSTATLYGIKNS